MLKYIRNDRGIALMMVLVISAIVLSVMSALLTMLGTGTQISGLKKRYSTAVEAAEGGQTVTLDFISAAGSIRLAEGLNMVVNFSETCKDHKLNKSTESWDPSCDRSLTIDIDDPATYDLRFDLGDYRVYSKIVRTVEGNSGRGGMSGLVNRGVINDHTTGGLGGAGGMQGVPYYYAIELETRNLKNLSEKARLSLLYEY